MEEFDEQITQVIDLLYYASIFLIAIIVLVMGYAFFKLRQTMKQMDASMRMQEEQNLLFKRMLEEQEETNRLLRNQKSGVDPRKFPPDFEGPDMQA